MDVWRESSAIFFKRTVQKQFFFESVSITDIKKIRHVCVFLLAGQDDALTKRWHSTAHHNGWKEREEKEKKERWISLGSIYYKKEAEESLEEEDKGTVFEFHRAKMKWHGRAKKEGTLKTYHPASYSGSTAYVLRARSNVWENWFTTKSPVQLILPSLTGQLKVMSCCVMCVYTCGVDGIEEMSQP